MTTEIEVIIDQNDELANVLLDNDINIKELIDSCDFEVKYGYSIDPASTENNGFKEPVSVIIASAAIILALTPILKTAIENITRRPVLISRKELKQVEDSSGKPLFDENGKPLIYWIEVSEFIEPKTIGEKQDVKIKGPLKLSLSFHSEKKA